MEKVESYRRLAIQARGKAETAKDQNIRRQLLEIAQEWESLADARLAMLALRDRSRGRS